MHAGPRDRAIFDRDARSHDARPVRRDRRPRAHQAVARAAQPRRDRPAARAAVGARHLALGDHRASCARWPTITRSPAPGWTPPIAGSACSARSRSSTARPTTRSSTSAWRRRSASARASGSPICRSARGCSARSRRAWPPSASGARRTPRRGWSWRSRSARTSPRRASWRRRCTSTSTRSSCCGSTTTWARRRRRTCSCCASSTASSSRCGTGARSSPSRSRWPSPAGIDGRADFYDATGALRDVGQNHLLQLLALTLMDAPTRAAGDELRAERLKVLRSIVPVTPGRRGARPVRGLRARSRGVREGSRTDTYAAMRVEVDNWRWAGVPCYLRTGKRLTTKEAEIAIAFRPSPHIPFAATHGMGGLQPADHRDPARGARPAARHRQAAGRRAGARQGRAGLRRGRGGRAGRARGLRAAAGRRAGGRQHAVHVQRRGRGAVGGGGRAGARAPGSDPLRRRLGRPRGRRRPAGTRRAALAAARRRGRAEHMTQTRKLADADVFPIGLGGMPMSLSGRPPEERSVRDDPRRARRRREPDRHRRRLLAPTTRTSATTSG